MPVFEYECDRCIDEYNSDISTLVEKLNKSNATKIMKRNPKFCYVEVYDDKRSKPLFALGEKGKYNKYNIRRFSYKLKKNKMAPRPGDELAYHFDYKKKKDEEMASSWVGYDYLDQYFQR